MDNRNLVLEINAKNEIIRIARGRQSVLALLTPDGKTLTWKDANLQGIYRSSVDAFLTAEGISVETVLLEGQKADVVPDTAPSAPKMHKMQGDLTPDYLEWLMKWKPIAFQNQMGVYLRPLAEGETPPKDPRDLWERAKVARTDTRPDPASQGGMYVSTRFAMENQIIARRASHLTFTKQEIFRGQDDVEQAEPVQDPHHPATLHKMAAQGKAEILSVKTASASAGSVY